MTKWIDLSKAFKTLVAACPEGGKSSDGFMQLNFYANSNELQVHFYAYCMPNMARHHILGPFVSEEDAWYGTRHELQAEVRYINALREDWEYRKLNPIEFPDVLKETEEERQLNQHMFDSDVLFHERQSL